MLQEGCDLESALNKVEIDEDLEVQVIELAASLIESHERKVIEAVIAGRIELPLSGLLSHLLTTIRKLTIITTNYDRLIELAAEVAGIDVDTTFYGQILGAFDPRKSHEALGHAEQTRIKAGIKRTYRKHVKVLKPHGSLDWFSYNGSPVRCGVPVDLPRLMIAPGKTKYRRGYEQPFDVHRAEANDAVDRAARFLFLGYGFNDSELETHLVPRLREGLPCVILTEDLTANAVKVVRVSPSTLALTKGNDETPPCTKLTLSSGESFFEGIDLWNIKIFIDEVLK